MPWEGKAVLSPFFERGKAVRWNTGLQEAVFACFLKNIMLHKNWKLISECVFHFSRKNGNYIKSALWLLFHFLICLPATNSLYLWLTGGKGKAERDGIRSCFVFSFPPVIIFSGWLVQGSNTRRKERFSDHLPFLE